MKRFLVLPFLTICFASLSLLAQDNALQVNAPVAHRTMQAPDPNASAADLEAQGDQLRAEKGYLDAMDFYHAAMKKASTSAAKSQIWNKIGITELQTGHFPGSEKRVRARDQGRLYVPRAAQQSWCRVLRSEEV